MQEVFVDDFVHNLLVIFNIDSLVLEHSVRYFDASKKGILRIICIEQRVLVINWLAFARDVSVVLRTLSRDGQANFALTRFDEEHARWHLACFSKELSIFKFDECQIKGDW